MINIWINNTTEEKFVKSFEILEIMRNEIMNVPIEKGKRR